jgi:hypothetical protein
MKEGQAVLLGKFEQGVAVVTMELMRTINIANFRSLHQQALAQKLPKQKGSQDLVPLQLILPKHRELPQGH